MSVVLNEYEWAEEAVRNKSLGKKPSETLGRVAKYYISRGSSKTETRKLLEDFLRQCDPVASIPKWSNMIDYSISKAMKYGIIEIDSIEVTDRELDRINSLEGRPVKRLAFTLLCLAKYWDTVNPKGDHWVINKDTEIMKLANINTSLRRQSAMFSELNKLGMIQFSRKIDNTSIRVCFIEDGKTEMKLCDFRDLGYQYLMHMGEPYYACESCGLIMKKKSDSKVGRKSKYCPECAAEIKIKQNIASVMKSRSKK